MNTETNNIIANLKLVDDRYLENMIHLTKHTSVK